MPRRRASPDSTSLAPLPTHPGTSGGRGHAPSCPASPGPVGRVTLGPRFCCPAAPQPQ